MPAQYPEGWETSAVLQDGSTVRIRPIKPADSERLAAFHKRQSPESIYLRFFQFRPELSQRELEFFTNIDYERRMAFVALLGDELVAVARYETPHGGNAAEVAFFVDDDYHGRGLATLMLEYLAAAGRKQGLDGFTASVLPENYGMLRVFRRAGFEVSTGFEDGAIAVTLGIELTTETHQAIEDRDRTANARSVARLLEPESVVVIGAGRQANSIGHRILADLVEAPFHGDVHVVNPAGGRIAGVDAVQSVSELPPGIDLAIVATPVDAVEQIVIDCIENGVGGLVVISAGFSDAGELGVEREQRLVDLVRRGGVRLIGPNAFGVANTDPTTMLHALFLRSELLVGEVGLLSQSGPLGSALLGEFAANGVGLSTFVAVGNRADVSVNDVLHYWAEDDRTSAVALYLENVGNVSKFTRIARTLSPTKPIVCVRPSLPERAELLRQSGVILVDEVAQLAEQAGLASHQPVPSGRRLAVVGNSASVSRLAVAACQSCGLEVVDSVVLDRTGSEDTIATDYEHAVVATAVRSDVDAVLLAIVPTPGLSFSDVAQLFGRIDRAVEKPMVATGLTGVGPDAVPGLPVFDFPDRAARCLGRWVDYGEWKRRDRGDPIHLANVADIEQVAEELLEHGDNGVSTGQGSDRLVLDDADAADLLAVVGVDQAPAEICTDLESALQSAERLGYPVALKAGGLEKRAAGESGGTALDIHDESELSATFHRMQELLGSSLLPVTVQRMVRTGAHLRVVMRQEPDRGARLTVGYGGRAGGGGHAAVQVLPAGENEIRDLAEVPWLDSATAFDGPALLQMLRSLAGAAGLLPGLERVELDPVLLSPDGAVVVDASVEIRRIEPDPLSEVRHLGQ